MKVIIAGSRTVTELPEVIKAIKLSGFEIKEVVSGACPKGVDQLGEYWANLNNIPIKQFIAQWSIHGKGAGVLRNQLMADYADALIAVWDGESKGTADMIVRAQSKGLKVFIYKPESPYKT